MVTRLLRLNCLLRSKESRQKKENRETCKPQCQSRNLWQQIDLMGESLFWFLLNSENYVAQIRCVQLKNWKTIITESISSNSNLDIFVLNCGWCSFEHQPQFNMDNLLYVQQVDLHKNVVESIFSAAADMILVWYMLVCGRAFVKWTAIETNEILLLFYRRV